MKAAASILSRRSVSSSEPPVVSPPKMLGVADFLTLEELLKMSFFDMCGSTADLDELEFVGEGWLEKTMRLVTPLINQTDAGAGGKRVTPGALIGQSRSGKTRAMLEIGRQLRKDGLGVIFVSFNDGTPYEKNESSSLRESLLARIAYAIAKPEVIDGKTLHDKSKLRFTTTEDDVLTWLANNKVVLLIDELNAAVQPDDPQADEVADFLRKNFISTKGRLFIFTTHFANTREVFELIGGKPSGRVVRVLTFPLIKSRGDVDKLTRGKGIRNAHPAYYGYSPVLVAAVVDEGLAGDVDRKQELALEELREISPGDRARLYREVLADVLEPSLTSRDFIRTFEKFARTLGDPPDVPLQRSWSPFYLIPVLYVASPADQPKFEKGIFWCVVEILGRLYAAKFETGEAWEVACTCAIMLRFELLRCATKGEHFALDAIYGDKNILLPPDLVAFLRDNPSNKLHVKIDDFQDADGAAAVASLLVAPPSFPAVTFLLPKHGKFTPYDMMLVYHPAAGARPTVYAYQFKSGDPLPAKVPLARVDKSFWIRGSRDPQDPDLFGWTILTTKQRAMSLGPTFAPLLEFEKGS